METLLTVKEALVERLRDEIISGKLRPGERLRLKALASQFSVSTTPLREALLELEAEGLVTKLPRRGTAVAILSAEDLQDIYDIRTNLEELATKLAVPQMDEATLADLSQIVEQMEHSFEDAVPYTKMNHQFHLAIYAAAGRRHLYELIEVLRRRTQHYVHAHVNEMGRMPQSRVDHRAILEACQRGDAQQAAMLMREHLVRVGAELVQHFKQLGRDT